MKFKINNAFFKILNQNFNKMTYTLETMSKNHLMIHRSGQTILTTGSTSFETASKDGDSLFNLVRS